MACLCGRWLRYLPEEDDDDDDYIVEDEYEKLVAPAIGTALKNSNNKNNGNVANVIANFEKRKDEVPFKQGLIERGDQRRKSSQPAYVSANRMNAPSSDNNKNATYSGMAMSKASKILGRFYSGAARSSLNNKDGHENTPTSRCRNGDSGFQHNDTKSQTQRRSFKVSPAPDDGRRCRICGERFFPTDQIITAQKHGYHFGCFKCTLCASKLKNHPDEDHMLQQQDGHQSMIILQCQRCKLDNDTKYKPRIQSTTAGQRMIINEDEQGDCELVKELIGDELEDAVVKMIPRCNTCGGDFLRYNGDIVLIGALKHHKECWEMGKPAPGFQPSLTLQPIQAATHLPDTFILRLSEIADTFGGKQKLFFSTLFFIWTKKDEQLKALRAVASPKHNNNHKKRIRLFFHLDEDVRANPNHKTTICNKQTYAIPPCQDPTTPPLQVDIMNNQIRPKAPRMVEPCSIEYSQKSKSSVLCAQIEYMHFNLHHLLNLNIPCHKNDEDRLDLSRATLMVYIQELL